MEFIVLLKLKEYRSDRLTSNTIPKLDIQHSLEEGVVSSTRAYDDLAGMVFFY